MNQFLDVGCRISDNKSPRALMIVPRAAIQFFECKCTGFSDENLARKQNESRFVYRYIHSLSYPATGTNNNSWQKKKCALSSTRYREPSQRKTFPRTWRPLLIKRRRILLSGSPGTPGTPPKLPARQCKRGSRA